MNTRDYTMLTDMAAHAKVVVDETVSHAGHPGWWSYRHQFSMIAAKTLQNRLLFSSKNVSSFAFRNVCVTARGIKPVSRWIYAI
jgi:hypothetical protein